MSESNLIQIRGPETFGDVGYVRDLEIEVEQWGKRVDAKLAPVVYPGGLGVCPLSLAIDRTVYAGQYNLRTQLGTLAPEISLDPEILAQLIWFVELEKTFVMSGQIPRNLGAVAQSLLKFHEENVDFHPMVGGRALRGVLASTMWYLNEAGLVCAATNTAVRRAELRAI